jgi:DNA-binding transcriptional ArsR family regulator
MGDRDGRGDSVATRVDFVSPRLAAALSHPTRVGVMTQLIEGPASPRQLASAMGEPLNNVTYHVNQLRDLGCIELERTERRAGGRVLERFYRTSRRAYFDADAWETLAPAERLSVTWGVVRKISEDISTAMSGGTFFGERDPHVSRSPMVVDEEGWDEVTAVLDRATRELFDVAARAAERSDGDGSRSIPLKVEMLQFGSPPPLAGADDGSADD